MEAKTIGILVGGLAAGALLNRFVVRRYVPDRKVGPVPVRLLTTGVIGAGVGLGGYVLLPEDVNVAAGGIGAGALIEEAVHRVLGK
jgi:uncharacterized membrane protein (UPF0136 family)